MANSTLEQPDTHATYGVNIAGCLYPRRLRKSGDRPHIDEEQERNGEIALRLWEMLPWKQRSREDFEDLPEMVKCYGNSLKLIELRHQEVADLLWEVCQCNLTVKVSGFEEDDPRAEQIESKLARERFEQAGFRGFEPDNILSAELLGESIEHVYGQLSRSLWQMTHHVVQSVFEAMDRFVDNSILGIIDWTSDSVCKFHFFTESALYQRAEKQGSYRTEFENRNWTVVEKRKVDVQEESSSIRYRHEHHLMVALPLDIHTTKVDIPVNIQPIIDKIPEWLLPNATVVKGEQFCEDVIEQVCDNRVWLKETVTKRKVRISVDPAVVIDRFVLAGWGEKEILEEEDRRHAVQTKTTRQDFIERHERSTKYARWLGNASVVCLALGFLASSALFVVALSLLGMSLRQTTISLQNAARFYRKKPKLGYLIAGNAGMACHWCGMMIAIAAVLTGTYWTIFVAVLLYVFHQPLLRNADSWLSVQQLFSHSQS